jgi:hypothetical protein
MRFKTFDTLPADRSAVDGIRRKFETIACVQGEGLVGVGKDKGDRSAHDVDDLVVGVQVWRVQVVRTICPGIVIQALVVQDLGEFAFNGGVGCVPADDGGFAKVWHTNILY